MKLIDIIVTAIIIGAVILAVRTYRTHESSCGCGRKDCPNKKK